MSHETSNVQVELSHDGDRWTVRIAEGGAVTARNFEVRSYAESFAEGQRLRLGLKRFSRVGLDAVKE